MVLTTSILDTVARIHQKNRIDKYDIINANKTTSIEESILLTDQPMPLKRCLKGALTRYLNATLFGGRNVVVLTKLSRSYCT